VAWTWASAMFRSGKPGSSDSVRRCSMSVSGTGRSAGPESSACRLNLMLWLASASSSSARQVMLGSGHLVLLLACLCGTGVILACGASIAGRLRPARRSWRVAKLRHHGIGRTAGFRPGRSGSCWRRTSSRDRCREAGPCRARRSR
jgi:hypothetical protein